MSSVRFIIKQQWRIEEISIFCNSSRLSDTILKGTHPRTIPARFGLIWFRGFRGEDLNVKVYDIRQTPSDGKSSHGLWSGELKSKLESWKVWRVCCLCEETREPAENVTRLRVILLHLKSVNINWFRIL